MNRTSTEFKKTFYNRIEYYNENVYLHRENNLPVVEYNDGDKEWYLNGIEYTEEEYTIKLKLKKIIKIKKII